MFRDSYLLSIGSVSMNNNQGAVSAVICAQIMRKKDVPSSSLDFPKSNHSELSTTCNIMQYAEQNAELLKGSNE